MTYKLTIKNHRTAFNNDQIYMLPLFTRFKSMFYNFAVPVLMMMCICTGTKDDWKLVFKVATGGKVHIRVLERPLMGCPSNQILKNHVDAL